ncbi:hypothetical protein BB558_005346 [Smittium angustum]|uniref:Uncharacterized protein n=1 Tax=Smittium angustum TaxID=133377 RepID=A0A2U1J0Q1_SMIAN|nr:hypothetical protein BB558_005346 [Smittium angustum]
MVQSVYERKLEELERDYISSDYKLLGNNEFKKRHLEILETYEGAKRILLENGSQEPIQENEKLDIYEDASILMKSKIEDILEYSYLEKNKRFLFVQGNLNNIIGGVGIEPNDDKESRYQRNENIANVQDSVFDQFLFNQNQSISETDSAFFINNQKIKRNSSFILPKLNEETKLTSSQSFTNLPRRLEINSRWTNEERRYIPDHIRAIIRHHDKVPKND